MPLLAIVHRQFRAASPWLLLAGVVLGVFALCVWALQPPPPRAAGARPDQFSEPRARAIVDHLSEDIGVRLNGTPGHRRAAEYLASELRKIPRLEVEIQEVADTQIFSTVPFPPFVYRTLNVVGPPAWTLAAGGAAGRAFRHAAGLGRRGRRRRRRGGARSRRCALWRARRRWPTR